MRRGDLKRIAPWAALAVVVAASFALGWSLTGQATAQDAQELSWYCFAQTEDGVTYFSRTGRAATRAEAEHVFLLLSVTEATTQGKKLASLSCGSEWPDRADELYASAGDFAALAARVAALEAADDVATLATRVAALETSVGDAAALTARVATLEAAANANDGEDGVAPNPGPGDGEDGVAPNPGPGDGSPTPEATPTPEASPTPETSPTPEATPEASPAPTPASTGGDLDRATQLAEARRVAGEDAVLPELGEDGVSLSCPDGYELSTSGNRLGCLRAQKPDGYHLQPPRNQWPAGDPSRWPKHPQTASWWTPPRAWFECWLHTEDSLESNPDQHLYFEVWATDAQMAEAQLHAVFPIGFASQNFYAEHSHGAWDDPDTFWYSEEETRRHRVVSHHGCRAYSPENTPGWR